MVVPGRCARCAFQSKPSRPPDHCCLQRSDLDYFDGSAITPNAGTLLLGAADRAIDLVGRFVACSRDARAWHLAEHKTAILVKQRVFGIALSQEELGEHDQLRHDPMLAVLASKLEARRTGCALWPIDRRRTGWSTRLSASPVGSWWPMIVRGDLRLARYKCSGALGEASLTAGDGRPPLDC